MVKLKIAEMDKKKIIFAILVILLLSFTISYNYVIVRDRMVMSKWNALENGYLDQAEIIPMLVNSCLCYSEFSASLLKNMTDSRSEWVDSAKMADVYGMDANGIMMTGSIDRFTTVFNNNPKFKDVGSINSLMTNVTIIQSAVGSARNDYITSADDFNVLIGMFPFSMFGFSEKQYFK